MDSITITRYARLLAVPIPFALAGYSFSFSQNTVPLTYSLPASHSTSIFRGVYTRGAAIVAPGGILGAASAAWLAYALPSQQREWATVAVVNLLPLVWTRIVMNSGIQSLLEMGRDEGMLAKAASQLEVRRLLETWVVQNWVRAGLYVVAGALAWRATMVVRRSEGR